LKTCSTIKTMLSWAGEEAGPRDRCPALAICKAAFKQDLQADPCLPEVPVKPGLWLLPLGGEKRRLLFISLSQLLGF
jgi:hypothetical protein